MPAGSRAVELARLEPPTATAIRPFFFVATGLRGTDRAGLAGHCRHIHARFCALHLRPVHSGLAASGQTEPGGGCQVPGQPGPEVDRRNHPNWVSDQPGGMGFPNVVPPRPRNALGVAFLYLTGRLFTLFREVRRGRSCRMQKAPT